jgi:O-methyltransferase involved in polyketide biosynthesis
VFYYFLTEQVKALVQQMAYAFPGSVLVFDAANRTAVKMIAKNMAQKRENQGCRRIFCGFGRSPRDQCVG